MVIDEHEWPTDQTQHVWSRWFTKNRTTIYRTCVHPKCDAFEEKAAKA